MLTFSTMAFGWVTEQMSRPDPGSRENGSRLDPGSRENVSNYYAPESFEAEQATSRHTMWKIGSPRYPAPQMFGGIPWPASFERLCPHVLGYFPYIAVWAIIWDMYRFSVDEAVKAGSDGPPDFVTVLVIGEIITFSSFGAVQLYQQAWHRGCVNYWLGEVAYIVLSIVAKGLLGGILITNILLVSSSNVDDVLTGNA